MKYVTITLLLAVGVAAGAQPIDCTKPENKSAINCIDDRLTSASFYLGEAIDTFAGDETLTYLNPDAANRSTLRAVAGADFDLRLFPNANQNYRVWLFGETVHGVRSRDVNCNDPNTVKLSVCSNNLSSQTQADIIAGKFASDPGDKFIAILRGASTMEAFFGVRYEFPQLFQPTSETPLRAYLKAQAGFLTVSGGGGDVVDMHQFTTGVLAVNGTYAGSYLEIGVGRNDLFHKRRGHRAKVDGYLEFDPKALVERLPVTDRVTPFIQFVGDFDLGRGSDSIQTYFGLNFKIRRKQ